MPWFLRGLARNPFNLRRILCESLLIRKTPSGHCAVAAESENNAVLWRKRHKRFSVTSPTWERVMSVVRPDKWDFLAPSSYCPCLVRCEVFRARHPLPHGKETRESPEAPARQSPPRAPCVGTPPVARGRYGHVQDTRESTQEPQTGRGYPASSDAIAVRCCKSGTPQRWGHEKATRESARETQAQPQPSAGSCGRAAAVGGRQGDYGNSEAVRRRHRVHDVPLAGWLHCLRQRETF